MTARHGTRRGYQVGCRCFPCSLAQSRYRQKWRAGGRSRFPADPVRDHVRALLASGWTQKALGEAAGLGNSTIWHLLGDGQESVNSRTAQALLNVRPLTPEGLRGHLQQLVASGLSPAQIAAEAGVDLDTVAAHLAGVRRYAKQAQARALIAVEPQPEPIDLDPAPLIAALGTRLQFLDPSDRRAICRARQEGRIAEAIADRIAVAADVGPLCLIYGLEDVA